MLFNYSDADFKGGVIQAIMNIKVAEETDAKLKAVLIAVAHMPFLKGVTGQGIQELVNLSADLRVEFL
jgi:hypothetical protein